MTTDATASKGANPEENRVVQLLLLVSAPFKPEDFIYEITYKKFAYVSNYSGKITPAQTLQVTGHFHPYPRRNNGTSLAGISDEYNLFTYYDYLRVTDDSTARSDRISCKIYHKNSPEAVQSFTANWYFKKENLLSAWKNSLTSATSGEPDNTQQQLQLKGDNHRCISLVPKAPKHGICSYYYRPYPGELVTKTAVNFTTLAEYYFSTLNKPQKAAEIFLKLYHNTDTLLTPDASDPNWSRWHNFVARHQNCGHVPPRYYVNYGYYYCSTFQHILFKRFDSEHARQWLTRAKTLLQEYMDKGLDINNKKNQVYLPSKRYPQKNLPTMNADVKTLELVNATFKTFAFNSHVPAYLDAGIADIPIDDMVRLFTQPNIEEWIDTETMRQAYEVAWEVIPEQFKKDNLAGEIWDGTWDMAKFIIDSKTDWWPFK